ncbi:PD40 domain-containing protein [Catellatospora paridis]|uniref:PD40 domain-containing protein n=1 Tax=Catellatospora paridis TaxID=1617086 RepID=UPI0012D47F49|nr:PD40 domain-containing protein [Catellatospora paridis]
MSETLREALRRAAESAPAPRLDGQVWRRGRRRRRVRRTATALAGVLLVAGLAAVPGLGTGGAGLQTAGGPVPGVLGRPYPWQLTYEQDLNGPVAAAFVDPHTVYLAATGVLVGRDGSYRLFPMDPGEDLGFVSPDGRYLARRSEIVDLVTGRGIPTVDRARPLAWSPDGRRLLLVLDRDDGVIEQRSGDLDEVAYFDLDTGGVKAVLFTAADTPAGAFSPDGERVAVTTGEAGRPQTLTVVDLVSGTPNILFELTDRQRLAGEAAWTPDGRSVMLVAADGCVWASCEVGPDGLWGWRLQYVDPVSGKFVDEAAPARQGRPRGLVGWRDGKPVFVDQRGAQDPARLVIAEADGSARVLLTLALGASELNVPRDLVEHGTLGSRTANPLDAPLWAFAAVLACVVPPLLMVMALRRRRRAVRALRGSGVGQGAGADDLRAEGGDTVA